MLHHEVDLFSFAPCRTLQHEQGRFGMITHVKNLSEFLSTVMET